MRLLNSLLVVLCLAAVATAQPLAERVPSDAIVYIGWRGTNDPGPNFAGSHTEAVLKDSAVSKIVTETIPALVQLVEKKAPQGAEAARTVGAIAKAASKYPTAFYVSYGKDGATPRGGFLIQAGADRDALIAQVEKAIATAPDAKAKPPIRATAAGDAVAVLFGEQPDQLALPAEPAAAIASDAAFKAAVAGNEKDATYFAFVAVDRILALVEQQTKKPGPDAQTAAKIFKLVDELGLRGVQSFSMSGGFVGKDWRESSFLAVTGPRKGLLAITEGKPFSADLLKRVPASANMVSATRFDPNKFIAEIRRATNAVDPAWAQTIDQVTGAATAAIGKNLETGVLAPLGDEWVSYSSAEIGGTGILGTVLLNKPDDVMKAKQGLASTAIMLTNTATSFGGQFGISVKVKQIQSADVSVSYMTTPVVAPAWAFKDGVLYMGLYPQSVIAAVGYAGASIEENPKFKETIGHLEQTKPITMTYTDVATTLDDGYNLYQVVLRTYLGAADLFGGNIPEPLLPPLSTLQKHAAPVGSVAWADDTGFHSRSIGPYPGAELLAKGSIVELYSKSAPLSLSILLPSLNRAREAANRIKSAANLRTIGQAAFMYSNEDVKTGKFPDDFEVILRTQDVTPDIFINPRGANDVPPIPPGKTPAEALGDWVKTKSDYVYVGKGKTNAAADFEILAYEKPDGLEDGINVLFCDGHVDWVTFDDLPAVFKKAKLAPPEISHTP